MKAHLRRPRALVWLALIIVTGALTVLSASFSDFRWGADADLYAKHMMYRLERVQDVLPFFREHQEQYRVITPIGFQLFQPFGPGPIPADLKRWPQEVTTRLVGVREMATVVYPVVVIEDPDTRRVHIYNADYEHVYSLAPEPDYDYTPHLTARPWLARATRQEQEYWRAFYDPARVAMRMNLIEYADLEIYLYAQERVREEALRAASLADDEDEGESLMMMSMGGAFAISAEVEDETLVVKWLGDSESYYRIEFATSLTAPDWTFVHVVWGEADLMSWAHDLSVGSDLGFYRVEERALTVPADTSGDGMDDVWKMIHGLDPLDDGSINSDNGPDADLSGDGITNLEVFLAGGNPHIHYPPPEIRITWPRDGGVNP